MQQPLRASVIRTERAGVLGAGAKASDRTPSVWVLVGVHAGDTAQALTLARHLGWSYELKNLKFNELHTIPNIISQHNLWALTASARALLQAPWPDLVIAVGRRSVPAARWIRRQSGGRTKLVHLGRPRAPLAWFDLVVTTPQYGLPHAPNVLHNRVPLTEDPARVTADELALWRERLQHLPRPWIGVLVGGGRYPYRLDDDAARRLAETASARARAMGGSLLVLTSPRTDPIAASALQQAVNGPAHIHIFARGGDSPYRAVLALADRFIVTGESVSMLTEACRTGRPAEVYSLPRAGRRRRQARLLRGQAWLLGLKERLLAAGLISRKRDVESFVEEMLAARHLIRVGDPDPTAFAPIPDPLSETLARVRALFGGSETSPRIPNSP